MEPYDPEKHAGGRLVKTDTGFRVQWTAAVEKKDQPFTPAMVRFQKDDDGTAISAKDRIKASKKRAKQRAKDRKKAEAAAQANRENLNKGDEMNAVTRIAKAMVERDYTPRTTTKLAFWKALTALAEKNRQPGQSREQSFAKAITTGDGETLYRAYRMCKNGAEPTSWDCEDEPEPEANDMPQTSPAYNTMAAKAKKLADKLGLTFEQAFARVYSENEGLAKMDKAHHAQRVAKAMGAG